MTNIEDFIARWKKSSAAERSNFQSFMSELCDALGVPRPDPATENESENAYVFERNVRFQHDDGTQTTGRIDLYKRGCFVLEGKQSKKREGEATKCYTIPSGSMPRRWHSSAASFVQERAPS